MQYFGSTLRSAILLGMGFIGLSACGRSTLDSFMTGTGGDGGGGGGGQGNAGGSPGTDCGNGILEVGEGCDDGDNDDSDECLSSCVPAVCGDGIVHAGVEACDDGNQNDGDDCTNACALPTCGNGQIDPGEPCDDGNASDTDACLSTCLPATCGDGFVQAGVEPCDDGNGSNADECLVGCVLATCGDGFVQAGVEACDDGNNNDNDGCQNSCSLPSCPDGVIDPFEQCDDNNGSNNDACPTTCQNAVCGDGFEWFGVEPCDDGNVSNSDACVAGCMDAECGDGFLWVGVEECDDGNLAPNDGCSPTCLLPVCGDGLVELGEECDLGMANADRPALELRQTGLTPGGVVPIEISTAAPFFYNYFSASGHTGLEALNTSRIYYVRSINTNQLSLFIHHGIDLTTTGQAQPFGQTNFLLSGVPATSFVALADDTPAEFQKTSPTTVIGNWAYQNNTDGGVLSGLPFPGAWSFDLIPTFDAGIVTWQFLDGEAAPTNLAMSQTVTLTAFDSPSLCRLDCTVPFCGDGILDGGEVCDDGNNVGGDGCAANCL